MYSHSDERLTVQGRPVRRSYFVECALIPAIVCACVHSQAEELASIPGSKSQTATAYSPEIVPGAIPRSPRGPALRRPTTSAASARSRLQELSILNSQPAAEPSFAPTATSRRTNSGRSADVKSPLSQIHTADAETNRFAPPVGTGGRTARGDSLRTKMQSMAYGSRSRQVMVQAGGVTDELPDAPPAPLNFGGIRKLTPEHHQDALRPFPKLNTTYRPEEAEAAPAPSPAPSAEFAPPPPTVGRRNTAAYPERVQPNAAAGDSRSLEYSTGVPAGVVPYYGVHQAGRCNCPECRTWAIPEEEKYGRTWQPRRAPDATPVYPNQFANGPTNSNSCQCDSCNCSSPATGGGCFLFRLFRKKETTCSCNCEARDEAPRCENSCGCAVIGGGTADSYRFHPGASQTTAEVFGEPNGPWHNQHTDCRPLSCDCEACRPSCEPEDDCRCMKCRIKSCRLFNFGR